MGPSDQRVDPVGGDDQIDVAKRVERFHDTVELQCDPDALAARLQQVQELQATDRGEAIAVDRHMLVLVHKFEIGPRFHVGHEELVGILVVGAQKLERPFGEHDAEAEGGVARVLLDYRDVVGGIVPLHQIREIEPRRAAADYRDLHASSP